MNVECVINGQYSPNLDTPRFSVPLVFRHSHHLDGDPCVVILPEPPEGTAKPMIRVPLGELRRALDILALVAEQDRQIVKIPLKEEETNE